MSKNNQTNIENLTSTDENDNNPLYEEIAKLKAEITELKNRGTNNNDNEQKTIVRQADPFTDMVDVLLVKTPQQKDDVFVAVNGRRYQIKRGVNVSVPRPVADVLRNSEIQNIKADDYIESLIRDNKN